MVLPVKQGLKLALVMVITFIRIVEVVLPVKQGLKHMMNGVLYDDPDLVEVVLPVKQGLKLPETKETP